MSEFLQSVSFRSQPPWLYTAEFRASLVGALSGGLFNYSSATAPIGCEVGASSLSPAHAILPPATPIRRRGKSMSRRIGQNGSVFVKSNCKQGRCEHSKGLCPKYGRYWLDVPGQHDRQRVVVPFERSRKP